MMGVVEKAPTIVRLPFLVRTLVPGLAATAIVYPFTGWKMKFPKDAASAELADLWPLLGLLTLAVLLGGLVSTVLGDAIYKAYEGYRLWPKGLYGKRTKRHNDLIAHLLQLDQTADDLRKKKIWSKLRQYPLDGGGNPVALCPTMLGNILAEYEQYPRTRYGINVVFYWPRLWLQIDKERKIEIDSAWSIADGLLSLSAVSLVGGASWNLLAGLHTLAQWLHLPSSVGGIVTMPSTAAGTAIGGVGIFIVGIIAYYLSLPFHRKNGELFKSLFDVYRSKLLPLSLLSPEECVAWNAAWSYLQYLKVRCLTCGHHFSASLDACDKCQTTVQLSLHGIRKLISLEQRPPPAENVIGTEQ